MPTALFALVPCRASIRSEQLIYSSQFHVTSDSLARSFACSTVFRFLFCLWLILEYNSWSPKPFQPPSAGSGSMCSSISDARRTSATGIYFYIYAFCRPCVIYRVFRFIPPGFLPFPVCLLLCAFSLAISFCIYVLFASPCPLSHPCPYYLVSCLRFAP